MEAAQRLLKRCQEELKDHGTNLCETRQFTGEPLKARGENQYRVMHWNILANQLSGYEGKYANADKNFASPRECLPWHFRRWRILEEIVMYDPDIITLVELDEGEDLMTDLKPLGYEMIYIEKGFHNNEKEEKSDGTGIFWKTSMFEVVDKEARQTSVEKPGKPGTTLSQVYNVVALKPRNGGLALAICGLHLKSTKSQEGEDIRVKQMNEVITLLTERFMHYPVLICGDFNGSLVEMAGKDGEDIEPKAVNVAIEAGFRSLYANVAGQDPHYTSWKSRKGKTFKYTIDYLLGSESFSPKAVLGMVPDDLVPAHHFPNFRSASDHLSLVCDVEVTEPPPANRYHIYLVVGTICVGIVIVLAIMLV